MSDPELVRLLTEIRDLQRAAGERQEKAVRISQFVTFGAVFAIVVCFAVLAFFTFVLVQGMQTAPAPLP